MIAAVHEARVGQKLDQTAMVDDTIIRRADGCVCELKGVPKQGIGHPTITVLEISTGEIKSECCARAFDLPGTKKRRKSASL